MFRTASGLGITKIYLCGITPTPFDPKGKKRRDFVKTALGSEDEIAWESVGDIQEKLKELKSDGFEIVAIEQDAKSVDYKAYLPKRSKVALLVGSEVDGVHEDVLNLCDAIVEVPMLGLKESLNVTIAFAIVGYRLFDK